MYIPPEIITAVTATATAKRPASVTERVSVTVPVRHHDCGIQEVDTIDEFFGYDTDTIELRGSASIFKCS